MALATGQFTIIDYNDGVTLVGHIESNISKTQMYNPDSNTFNPNWEVKNPILTPVLFKIGTTTNIITDNAVQSVKWHVKIGGTETEISNSVEYALSGAKNHILTIKKNVITTDTSRDFICTIVYRDPVTNLDLTYKTDITFSRITNGGSIVNADIWCPNGNLFKNESIKSLTAQMDLWRGSAVDDTDIEYQWYMRDSSIGSDQGAGIGWKKLSDTSNIYTGTKSKTITVFADAVPAYAVFKCSAKDTDSTSGTYNQVFWDSVTFIDNSDPIQVAILSTGGSVFKNGVGTTTLTAKLYKAGEEVDSDGTKYNYKWVKYDKNGNLTPNFGGSGVNYKTGKNVEVTHLDVDVKATFSVEISEK